MKVAIIGGGAKEDGGLKKLLRHHSWEVWCVNMLLPSWFQKRYYRIDKMFHLHQWAALKKNIPEHLEAFETWADKHDEMEIVLLEPYEKLPRATIFPRYEMEYMSRSWYHCGSFDWIVAYAAHLGAQEIFLSGVGLHRESGEPMSAGPCLEYWCGYAEGKGVKVTTGSDCDLFWNYRLVRDHKAYGYDEFDLVETQE